jgi:phage terminase large subunit
MLIYLCLITKKLTVSIVRQSLPQVRVPMKDFFEIMRDLNLYHQANHNRTEHKYEFPNGSVVEFFGTIDDQKLRGRKRDILYINEANEISHPEYIQLAMRTSKTIFLDFNPSDSEHWIYDLLKDVEKSILIKSTFLDNPFLPQEQIDEINNLINVDPNYYKIYALGERPISESRIYSHFKQYSHTVNAEDWVYGLDFGFNDPNVLVKCMFEGNRVYIEELLYEPKLTGQELAIKVAAIVQDKHPIYCDTARPEIIAELRNRGLLARDANKAVREGIDMVKSMEIFIELNSLNVWKEYRLYSWKTSRDGRIIDERIDLNDHSMDAIRYAIYSHKKGSIKYDPKKVGIFTTRNMGPRRLRNEFE